MATISNDSLLVEGVNNTTVRVTVKYTLTPNAVEKLAGTVFSENIQLIGDDPLVLNDRTIATFPADAFAVSNATPSVQRTRIRNVLKSAMNEDQGTVSTGAEQTDEVFARIALAYAANPPIPSALPSPAPTNRVSGAWKP
ncbi:MAG: hypothetical protein WAQ99_05550 [Pyrinomonadaceae bacterium]